MRCGLAEQDSVASFVLGWDGPLDILVNNAGIMALPSLERNKNGWELQFATNHLGHFAVAVGLHEALAASGNARIVSVKSVEQGAATSVLLAASPLLDRVSGRYFEDCNEAEPLVPGIRRGVAAYALEPAAAARLWDVSLALTPNSGP
jgi:NAD(P)-dependent dehydrogenase (short-subunit alcohol dehydrogenase family)